MAKTGFSLVIDQFKNNNYLPLLAVSCWAANYRWNATHINVRMGCSLFLLPLFCLMKPLIGAVVIYFPKFRFIIAHIIQFCKGRARQTFLNLLGVNVLWVLIWPKQRSIFSWLYNMLYIFKTSLYSLGKDKYNLLYKLLCNKLWLGTEHITYDHINTIYALKTPI